MRTAAAWLAAIPLVLALVAASVWAAWPTFVAGDEYYVQQKLPDEEFLQLKLMLLDFAQSNAASGIGGRDGGPARIEAGMMGIYCHRVPLLLVSNERVGMVMLMQDASQRAPAVGPVFVRLLAQLRRHGKVEVQREAARPDRLQRFLLEHREHMDLGATCLPERR